MNDLNDVSEAAAHQATQKKLDNVMEINDMLYNESESMNRKKRKLKVVPKNIAKVTVEPDAGQFVHADVHADVCQRLSRRDAWIRVHGKPAVDAAPIKAAEHAAMVEELRATKLEMVRISTEAAAALDVERRITAETRGCLDAWKEITRINNLRLQTAENISGNQTRVSAVTENRLRSRIGEMEAEIGRLNGVITGLELGIKQKADEELRIKEANRIYWKNQDAAKNDKSKDTVKGDKGNGKGQK